MIFEYEGEKWDKDSGYGKDIEMEMGGSHSYKNE